MDENKEEVLLSEEEVFDVIEFARAASGMLAQMPVTVDLINQRMKQITMVPTGSITEAQVSAALSDPENMEQELLRISQAFENTTTIYKRLLHYVANLAAFDLTFYCKNATIKDYEKAAGGSRTLYAKDLDVVKEFLESFDYKYEFSKALKQMLRQETFFGVFRDDGDKFVMQELPSQRCKITGRWDYGILYSFDLNWFLQGGIDIDMYPPIFKELLDRYLTNNNGKKYNPSLPVDARTSIWAYYADVSPVDGFWGWKFSENIATRVPYFAGIFPDLVQQSTMRALQKSNALASASKIILSQVPMQKDTATKVKDMISVSPQILGQFMALVQQAISNESVKFASAPLEQMKSFEFKSDNDIYQTFIKNTLGSSGINSNLLFSADVKPNTLETQLSANIDEMLVTSIYPMFNNFMNYEINKRTKTYKFEFKFEGSNFYTDRDRRLKDTMTLAEKGIVLPQKIAAAKGMNIFEMQAHMDEARANGWVDNLTPIVSSFNMSKEGGRPPLSDSEIDDGGQQTREDGGNIKDV